MKADLKKIKKLIKERGLTQAQAAQAIGLSVTTLRLYLGGRYPISAAAICSLAEILRVSPDDLYAPDEIPSIDFEFGRSIIECPYCHSVLCIEMKVGKTQIPD